MNRFVFIALAALLLGIGAWYRLSALDLRPFHGDEANQAMKTGQLLEKGIYRYDPHEHHGPTLYYAALPVLRLCGARGIADASETMFRLVPALFGIATLALTLALARSLGYSAVLCALAFAAVSHGLTYYSRYYIQESMLVFFVLAAIVAGWSYLRRPGWLAAIGLGLSVGFAHATKETCVIFFAAMFAAVVATIVWGRIIDNERPAWPRVRWPHLAVTIAAAIAISITLYSSFFTYARGPLDSVLTFFTYAGRAEGAGSAALHDKPWHYYLGLLWHTQREAGPHWTEAPVLLLALAGLIFALRPRARFAHGDATLWRFLAFYALALGAAFSLVPYKTPWNFIGALHAMTLLAGLGAATIIGVPRNIFLRASLIILLCIALLHQARQSYLGNFVYPADARNPYVYAHTSTALMRLVRRVEDLAGAVPEKKSLRIDVIAPDGDYWPLPWYLRKYDRVGYWPKLPQKIDAAIVIAKPALSDSIRLQLDREYVEEMHALRPGVFLQAFIRQEAWDRMMQSR